MCPLHLTHNIGATRKLRAVACLHQQHIFRFLEGLWRGNFMLVYCDLWPKSFKIYLTVFISQYQVKNEKRIKVTLQNFSRKEEVLKTLPKFLIEIGILITFVQDGPIFLCHLEKNADAVSGSGIGTGSVSITLSVAFGQPQINLASPGI